MVVAKELAAHCGDEVQSMTDSPGNRRAETVGFVFPVYAWGLPNVVERFIPRLKGCGAKYVWCVMTCGDDMGWTDRILRRQLRRKADLLLDAVWSVQMPNTYVCLPGFDVDSEEVAESKVATTLARLTRIAETIRCRRPEVDVCRGAMPYTKSYLLRYVFNKLLVTDRYFHTTDDCCKCGRCVKNCPLRNISDDRKWKGNCAGCLRCYHDCPKHAVEFGWFTKGKGQKKCVFK